MSRKIFFVLFFLKLEKQFQSHHQIAKIDRVTWCIKIAKSARNKGWGSKFGTTKCRTTGILEFWITNIKMKKDESFDHFIFEFFKKFFRNYFNDQNI